MKIAVVVSTFPPYKGGMGNSAYEIAKILASHNEVTVFTPDYFCHSERGTSEESVFKSVELDSSSQALGTQNDKTVERIKPAWKIGNGAVLLRLWKKLKNFDVIYLHYPFYGTAEIVWLYKLLHPQKKLVVNFQMDTPNLAWHTKILSWPLKLVKNNLMKRADKVISASLDYVAHSSISKVWKKYPEKFAEIPYGVHLEKFHVLPHDISELVNLRKKYGIQDKDRVVMFLGALDEAHRFKGIDILLRAIAGENAKIQNQSYFKSMSKVKCLICGDGNLRNKYQQLAKDLKIDKQIIFTGRVPDEALVLHYNLADIFVLPSVDKSEAFGIVLLEAMACGVPVIASDLPGVRSVFEDGVSGYTVVPGSPKHLEMKLRDYLRHPGRRWKMGKAARERVEGLYDADLVAGKVGEVFGSKKNSLWNEK